MNLTPFSQRLERGRWELCRSRKRGSDPVCSRQWVHALRQIRSSAIAARLATAISHTSDRSQGTPLR